MTATNTARPLEREVTPFATLADTLRREMDPRLANRTELLESDLTPKGNMGTRGSSTSCSLASLKCRGILLLRYRQDHIVQSDLQTDRPYTLYPVQASHNLNLSNST